MPTKNISSFYNILNNFLDVHFIEVISKTSIALFLKLFASLIGFLLNLTISRMLGSSNAGIYFLCLTFITIASDLSRIGIDNSLIRFISYHKANNEWGFIKGLYNHSVLLILIVSIIVSILFFFITPFLSRYFFPDSQLSKSMRLFSFSIVPMTMILFHSNALTGLKRVSYSIILSSITIPLLSIIFNLVLIPIFGLNGSILSYFLSCTFAIIVGFIFWNKSMPDKNYSKFFFGFKSLLSSCFPLYISHIFGLIIQWSPVLFIGAWCSKSDVAIYSIANRTSAVISLIHIAANSIVAPKLSEIFRGKNNEELKFFANKSTAMVILLTFPLFIACLIFSKFIMGLFGPEFISGWKIFCILSIGQFASIITGPVGFILIMTGKEIYMRNIIIISSLLTLISCYYLTTKLDILGASIASTISLIFLNFITMFAVRKCFGFWTIPNFKTIANN